tara:strand:+ start:59 stop:289 length:231 start_codon:yes stop_codon:yes gene_type:complete
MPSQLEELLSAGPKESSLPKALSNRELEELLDAINLHFLFNYNEMDFFKKDKIEEIKLFLDLRHEVLSQFKNEKFD